MDKIAMFELLKLIIIITGGIIACIIIFIKQKKALKKKKEANSNIQNKNNIESLSQEELNAKNYIEQYKGSYPLESIKQGLLQSGYPEDKVNEWLNKYF